MLKINVEGIYETDMGSGQKKYNNFSYSFDVTRDNEEGIETHVLRRFIPMLIAQDKKKNGLFFSRMKSFYISDIQKIDNKGSIIGKDIMALNEWEIQDLACLFDLYEIPLHGRFTITQLRERAVEAYFKKVLKIPMKDAEEKAKLSFYKQLPDGTFKLDLQGMEVKVTVPEGYFEKQEEEKQEKKSLDFFLKKAGLSVANAILNATGNKVQQDEPQPTKPTQPDGFPSLDDLNNIN